MASSLLCLKETDDCFLGLTCSVQLPFSALWPSVLPSWLCVLWGRGGDTEGDGRKITAKKHERKSRMEQGMGGVPFYWFLYHKSLGFSFLHIAVFSVY